MIQKFDEKNPIIVRMASTRERKGHPERLGGSGVGSRIVDSGGVVRWLAMPASTGVHDVSGVIVPFVKSAPY